MDEQKNQFLWVVKLARILTIATLVLIALGMIRAVAMLVVTSGDAVTSGNWKPVLLYVAALLGLLVAAGWTLVLYGLIHAIVTNQAAVSMTAGLTSRIETLLEDHGHSLNRLINLQSLSDKAKSLIYRDRELEAMGEVIHEDMMRQDYDTAAALIDMMAQQFGYVDQAARLRDDLEQARQATLEEKIDSAIARIQRIIGEHDWPRALRAAEKVMSLFPDHPKAASLPQRVESERNNHKKRLLQDYGEAIRKNDIDRGVELLGELDRYLTPQEAAALQESARGVFKAKLHNLGVQFAIQVTDQRWSEAVATGEEIIRNFPNSRMSHEVRQKMPQLRELIS